MQLNLYIYILMLINMYNNVNGNEENCTNNWCETFYICSNKLLI